MYVLRLYTRFGIENIPKYTQNIPLGERHKYSPKNIRLNLYVEFQSKVRSQVVRAVRAVRVLTFSDGMVLPLHEVKHLGFLGVTGAEQGPRSLPLSPT